MLKGLNLESFKTQLDRVLCHLISNTLLPRKVGADNPWGAFQPGIL